jgi:hypothetical protein
MMGTRARLGLFIVGLEAGGCVVPIPAEPDDNNNGYPVIKDVTPASFAFPGPLPISIGQTATPPSITFLLSDSDRGDTLYVRVFRDYTPTVPLPFFNVATVPGDANGSEDRPTATAIDPRLWCGGLTENPPVQHRLDVMVADRPFDDPNVATQPRPYQGLVAGGLSSTQSYLMTCQP